MCCSLCLLFFVALGVVCAVQSGSSKLFAWPAGLCSLKGMGEALPFPLTNFMGEAAAFMDFLGAMAFRECPQTFPLSTQSLQENINSSVPIH